jgi:hypothetical protein
MRRPPESKLLPGVLAAAIRVAICAAVQAGDFNKAKVLGERLAQLEARAAESGGDASVATGLPAWRA